METSIFACLIRHHNCFPILCSVYFEKVSFFFRLLPASIGKFASKNVVTSSLRQLMEELNQEKARFDESESEYRSEVRRLRQENERQQKLIGQNLMKSTGSQAETLLQSEIMRLTSENLVSLRDGRSLHSFRLVVLDSQTKTVLSDHIGNQTSLDEK